MQMEKSAERLMPIANSNDGPPPLKRHCEFDNSSAKDEKPKIKKINEVLAVELLEMIVLCVPTKPTGKVWPREELSEITIARRFQLRNLCRLWRSIVYRNMRLTVELKRREGHLHGISVQPTGFQFEQAAGLFGALACSARQTDHDCSWADLIMHVRLDWNGNSTVSVLARLTKSVRHQVSLDLTPSKDNMYGPVKYNFRTSFTTQFPNLALAKLDMLSTCRSCLFDHMEFTHSASLTNFYLSGASSCLMELRVDLFTLDKAVTGFRTRRNGVSGATPWACNSLRQLTLWISPSDTGNVNMTRDATFAIQAKLPSWFPQLKQLQLDWTEDKPQFDFAVLRDFAALDDLALLADFHYAPYVRRDYYRLQSLPNVKAFALSGANIFPMHLALFVPNVCKLEIWSLGQTLCKYLTRQLSTNANALQNLRTLSLDFHQRGAELYPTRECIESLLIALHCAPHLVDFELRNVCPPKDISLLRFMPKGVAKLMLDCCLMPDWVGYDFDRKKWSVVQKRATRLQREEIYKQWIRDLLVRLADFPALQEFSCVAPTPKFLTARNLMAQWRRNITKLVADLNVNLTALALQSIDFDPVDNSATSLGLTAKLLASGDTTKSVRQIIAKIVFKDADYITY